MTMNRRFWTAVAIATATGVTVWVSTALGATVAPTLSFVARNRGLEFVTASGSTSVYPGHLHIGDRIFSRDALVQGARSVGYDNELCTVTFDNHELCQVTLVLPGQGQIQASWLWTDWPSGFTGVIDGGTGSFATAKGQFTATLLQGGALKISATLR
jgi:hypothetical protein